MSEGVAGTDRRVVAPRLRAAVLGPRGGGRPVAARPTRSRLGLAVVVVAVSIPIMRANSAAELWLVARPEPAARDDRWLVTSIFWLGSADVIVLLVVLGLLVPRLAALALASVAAVIDGSALPVNAISSLALGWGVAAGVHLAVGSPLGLPSAEEITEWIADLHVAVEGVTRAPARSGAWRNSPGTMQPRPGHRAVGLRPRHRPTQRRPWRSCGAFASTAYSGPTLILDRLQQVEHEAFLALIAERAGVPVPEVLAVGRFGPSRDAALVTRLPAGSWPSSATPTCRTLRWTSSCRPCSACARRASRAARSDQRTIRHRFRRGAMGTTRRWHYSFRRHRVHRELDRQVPVLVPGLHWLRRRKLPRCRPILAATRPAIWIVIGVVVARRLATVAITLVPRLRRLAKARGWPYLGQHLGQHQDDRHLSHASSFTFWPARPRLSCSWPWLSGRRCHAVGQQASIATLLVVITLASIIGEAVPVPGGMGVVEAGLIGGLGHPLSGCLRIRPSPQFSFSGYLPPPTCPNLGLDNPGLDARREYV